MSFVRYVLSSSIDSNNVTETQNPQTSEASQPATPPQTPSPETPTPQPAGQSKTKSNKILIVGVAMLLLAIIAASAYLFFQNQNNPATQPTTYEECTSAEGSVIQESYPATCVTKGGQRFVQPLTEEEQRNLQPPTTQIPTQQLSDELTYEQDQMLDWKKYSSSSYSFMYPPDVEQKEQGGEIISLSKWGPTQGADTEFFDGISLSFKLLDLSSTTLQEYVQSQIDDIETAGVAEVISEPDLVTINKYTGLTYTTEGLGTHKTIIIQSSGATVSLEITDSTVDPGNIGFSETVNKILSTFVFVE